MPYYRFDSSPLRVKIGKIVCLARTYKKHAEEMKSELPEEPILFLKPPSSIIFDNQSIIIPRRAKEVHHEVELGVVIGKKGKIFQRKKQGIIFLAISLRLILLQGIYSRKRNWKGFLDNSEGFRYLLPDKQCCSKGNGS